MNHVIRYNYLIEIQYLGFRYHGWQQQSGVITLEKMVRKTLSYILGSRRKKVLSAGRTDAMVSAFSGYIELILEHNPIDQEIFLSDFNKNLPPDIRALSICQVNDDFNIIQHPKLKEYVYLFSFSGKSHPFCAPFLTPFQDELNLDVMKEAARLFEGERDFRSFIHLPSLETQSIMNVEKSLIQANDLFNLPVFPDKTYAYKVKGKGFKRQQIRLMMGAIYEAGLGKLSLDDIKTFLAKPSTPGYSYIAPASGLFLNKIEFNQLEKHIIS